MSVPLLMVFDCKLIVIENGADPTGTVGRDWAAPFPAAPSIIASNATILNMINTEPPHRTRILPILLRKKATDWGD